MRFPTSSGQRSLQRLVPYERDQQRLADYLAHILEAIERIERYTEDMDEVAFLENHLVQDAVIRSLEIVGEASNQRDLPKFYASVHSASNSPYLVGKPD